MIQDFDGIVVEALKSVPEKTWSLLFQNLAQNKMNQISGTSDSDLIKLKAGVLAIQEIEGIFKIQRERKRSTE